MLKTRPLIAAGIIWAMDIAKVATAGFFDWESMSDAVPSDGRRVTLPARLVVRERELHGAARVVMKIGGPETKVVGVVHEVVGGQQATFIPSDWWKLHGALPTQVSSINDSS